MLILARWARRVRAQELCESGGGRPGLPSPISLTVCVGSKAVALHHHRRVLFPHRPCCRTRSSFSFRCCLDTSASDSGESLIHCFLVGVSKSYAIATSDISDRVQELCESRGGRPGLSVLTGLLVSGDVKLY